jgi:hypothetical protein
MPVLQNDLHNVGASSVPRGKAVNPENKKAAGFQHLEYAFSVPGGLTGAICGREN